MGEISHISIDQARFEPEAVFGNPRDLFADAGLTRGQKLATLARWRQHLIDKLRATGEGMAPAPSDTSADATMLSEVEKAEIELQEPLPQSPLSGVNTLKVAAVVIAGAVVGAIFYSL